MIIKMYVVNAFTEKTFQGNPAAVCLLDLWPDDWLLQKIAMQNNLSETAFMVGKGDYYELRWFTPKVEIDLCGHATLASAFVLFSFVEKAVSSIKFKTLSGILEVRKESDVYWMDFPSRKPIRQDKENYIKDAFGIEPVEVYKSRDLLVVFKSEHEIRSIKPDFSKLMQAEDCFGFIISAPGEQADFVSRFFAPRAGIMEDPVTGSSHSTLIPYWSQRLGKQNLNALQLSERGGELFCRDCGQTVKIGGKAVLYSTGEVILQEYNLHE